MKYKDIFTQNSGVFGVMLDVNPTLYNDLFGDTDSKTLDAFAYFVASEKTVFSLFTTETKQALLTSVFIDHAAGWRYIVKALTTEYNIIGTTTTESTKGSDDTKLSGNVTDVDSNKAFNSTDFVESDKREQATDTTNGRTYATEKTTTQTTAPQESIRAEIELRRTKSVLSTVLSDILTDITLLVYE